MNTTGNDSLLPAAHVPPTAWQVWGLGLLSVTIISSCAVCGIAIMPFVSKRLYHRALTYLVGLGVGSLSGSAIFHLLPQAFGITDDPSHGYLHTAAFAVLGIYMFFFTDKLLKLIMVSKKKLDVGSKYSCQEDGNCGNGQQQHAALPKASNGHNTNGKLALTDAQRLVSPGGGGGDAADELDDCAQLALSAHNCTAAFNNDPDKYSLTAGAEKQAHGFCAHDHDVQFKSGDSVIATVAWMIVFGDGLHNLVDGLSIGAAFTESPIVGISVSIAVLAEEFPHELGDVAILVSAGMTVKQALTYNVLSALTCYFGFVLGVLMGEMKHLTPFIFAVAGGMFLYISLASMIPEMNEAMSRQLAVSRKRGLMVLLLQSAGLATGIALMYLFARYGGDISLA